MKDTNAQQVGLDRYLEESEKRIEAIQHYLRSQVEPILQSLCLGFVQNEVAGSYTRETLDEIYRNAIFLLYRILFLYYAEARGLLPTQDANYQHIGLAGIVEDARLHQQEGIHDPDSFSLWKRLTHLFVVVDDGDESVGVRPYNGGLFNDSEKPYLKTHRITNAYLAPALFELGYMQSKAGIYPVDYCDLSVRHLGTLYEGLLEYRLNLVDQEPVVVRENKGNRVYVPRSQAGVVKRTETILEVGAVYFADDKGVRKSSGTYYTPEDVVQYIVSNTVLPKLQEHRRTLEMLLVDVQRELTIAATKDEYLRIERYADEEALKTVEQDLLGLRILDPAMGSAHFLVAAGQVATNFIVETLNMTEWTNSSINSDPLDWKRRVVERCLYGVDLNPLAHELAKLALWLSSASVGKPLTFLDHHLKIGNSLYGAPLNRLSALPTARNANKQDLFQERREQIIQTVMKQLEGITRIDSDHIEDVKYKGEINRSVIDSTQRLRDIANVWLGTLFGLQNSNGQPVDEQDYQRLLEEVISNDTDESWKMYVNATDLVREARDFADCEDKRFFHWELEFPDTRGADGRCRFDVIIANPPYAGTQPNLAILTLFATAKCRDIYSWLFELSLRLTKDSGTTGMIVPLSLMFSRDMKSLRNLLLEANANTYISAFDATRDGIFQPNGESRNGQRASIVIHCKQKDEQHVYTTNLIRWIGEERPFLFSDLHYANVTPLVTAEVFPKLGDSRLVELWKRTRVYGKTIGTTIYKAKKNGKEEDHLPPPILYQVYVPSTARYFITAMPTAMRSTGLNTFSWENRWERDVAIVALNSNVFYWIWCVLGDGFHVTAEVVNEMVLPDVPEDDSATLLLYKTLLNAAEECVTYHSKWGERIPNYNFNKRMDILLDIDAWIVRHLAPDLDLPRDIFAQYKSNSFLQALDLSAILEAEVDEISVVGE